MSISPAAQDVSDEASQLYASSVVVDGCAPSLLQDTREWRRFADAGVTAIFATVTTADDMPGTVESLASFHRLARTNAPDLVIAESVADVEAAKRDGRLAMVLQFQNGRPLGRDRTMVEMYARMGVRVIQLTYNYRNNIGDGCLEPANSGLSAFGRDVVRELNEQRVLVDLSHTGERTTLEAMEVSTRPDVFTHANARAVHDHPRNLTDEQITTAAAKGGLVGLCAFPGFITDRTTTPTVGDLVAHLDHMVSLVGIDHVSLGNDFYFDSGYWPNIEAGNWSADDWPTPPWHYPLDGGNTVELVHALLQRGFTSDDVRKLLGTNLLRVMREVWGR